MPKKQSSTSKQGISSRPVLIVLGATAFLAAAIFVVFASLIGKNESALAPDYQNYLQQLKKQATVPTAPTSQSPDAAKEVVRQTVAGVLTAISQDELTIAAQDTKEKITVNLNSETTAFYQNLPFDRTRFFVGDQLKITARQETGSLTAEKIIVLVSASPATPAPAPPLTPQNIRPDGSIKPL